MSTAVIGFQLAILATIVIAGFSSRRALWLSTIAWVAFTLFGSIFTAGLLLLQLVTIGISYLIGSAVSPKKEPKPAIALASSTSDGIDRWLMVVAVVVIAVIAGRMLGRESANRQIAKVQTMRTERAQQASNKKVDSSNVSLNEGLPMMLDSETMITRIDSDPNSTTYHLKMINYAASEFNQRFLANAQESAGRRNCANSDILWSYDQGMTSKYIVSGSDNRRIGSFVISKHYCSRFK